ncbi:MAG: hypothetical protein PHV20_02365 [Bacteroidales bacterium]|nr:hypothetical protein [Bacteroidales bacterium]
MKTLFNSLLVVSILVLGFLCVKSIMDPIHFDEERAIREKAVINRLMDIRKAQMEYRNMYGQFTGSFDTLISFVKKAKIPFVLKEGTLSDIQLEAGMTEKQAVREGLIKRDTFFVVVKDTLFPKNFNADSMCYVPHTSKKFQMAAGHIVTSSGVPVKVFECKTDMDDYLSGLDRQEIVNLKDKAVKMTKFPGLKVGSLEEANNSAGNWE